MTTDHHTDYGRVIVGAREELFIKAVLLASEQQALTSSALFTWALTGGSTPQDWYRWCVETRALPLSLARHAHFTVSDERHVPLESDQSNFGQAERRLFNPLNVPAVRRHPWPVANEPVAAAEVYARAWADRMGEGKTYDLCFLGMGDDGHTASIFPGSPLLKHDGGKLFTALDVPGRGWRLTITPTGLGACGRIVVMALGAGKASTLKRVLAGPCAPEQTPSQCLRAWRDRVVWLIDAAAASELSF